MYRRLFAAASFMCGVCCAETDQVSNSRAHELFKELIEINTTESVGSVTAAAEAMATRLRGAGFPDSDPPPALIPEVMKPLDTLVAQMWPGLKVIPAMSAGACDGVYTSAAGLPTYTIAGVAIDKDNIRAHWRDENISIESFDKGNEFFYRYMKLITAH